MRSVSPVNPNGFIPLLAAAAMGLSLLAQGWVQADTLECRRRCDAKTAQSVAGEHACCAKHASTNGNHREPLPSSTDHPHCPCCVAVCAPAAMVITGPAKIALLPSPCFDRLSSPPSLRGGDWVDDLFHPPCL